MCNTSPSFEKNNIKIIVNLQKQIGELSKKLNNITKTLEINNIFKQSNILCDVILLADDGVKIPAHKVILASASPVFLTMFNENFEEKNKQVIPIKGINSTILNVLFDYIYTFKLNVTVENVEEILRAADYFNMDNIKNICYDFVEKVMNYENCFNFMKLGELISFKKLYDLSFSFVLQHFFKLKEFTLGNMSLYDLPCKEILKFISNDNLITVSEEKVFHFVLDWVKFDEENRKEYFSQLIKCVRFSYLSNNQLRSVFNEPLVRKDNNCLTLIMESVMLHLEENNPEPSMSYNILSTVKRRLPLHFGNPKVIIAIKNDAIDVNKNYASFFISPVNSGFTMQTFKDKLFVPPKRCSKIVALENGVLFSIGGETDGIAIKDVFILDLSYLHPTWMLTTPMIVSRKDFAVCLYNNNIYAIGGIGEDGVTALDSIEIFDIETKTWSLIEVQMSPRSHCSAIYYNGSICVIGGKNENHSSTESIECIKVSSGDLIFIDIKPLPFPLHNTSVTIFNNTLYVIGGKTNNIYSNTIYKISLLNGGEWSSVATLEKPRHSASSVVYNGKLIIYGGVVSSYDVNNWCNTFECYDIFDEKFFSYNDELNVEFNSQSSLVFAENLFYLVGVSLN